MPRFMENHIETYLETYPEQWMNGNLQDYLFTAHRITSIHEHRNRGHEKLEYCNTSHEYREYQSRIKRDKGQRTDINRYCLVGSIKSAIEKPYQLFRRLKCSPIYISTPLDVALYSGDKSKEDGQQVLLLECKKEWHGGIYESGVCILNFTLSKGDERKALLELGRVLQFYALQSSKSDLKMCYIFWQYTKNEYFETLLEETFDLEVQHLTEPVLLSAFKKRFEESSILRRVL